MKYLIIGMGPGIGLSSARKFGREGFEVIMVARSESALREFSEQLTSEGITNSYFPADIADEDSFLRLLEHLAAEHPNLDTLHYNASAFNPGMPSEISLTTFATDLKVNVTGALMAAQAFFPSMKQHSRGNMFFTGGGSALYPNAQTSSLGVGKAAMRHFALSLAQECEPAGIHVATVTVCGMVKPGTRFDPDLIADEFWRLHQQPRTAWKTEIMWQ